MPETDPNSKRLTVEDPIDPVILNRFGEMEGARMRLGAQLLEIEAEKVKIMVAARQIDVERQRLFEKVLSDRGVAPSTPVEIDSVTGKIRVLAPPPQASNGEGHAAQAAPAAAPPS